MALMVILKEACRNLKQLQKEGFEGAMVFMKRSIIHPSRLPRRQNNAIVSVLYGASQRNGFSYRLPIVCLINPCKNVLKQKYSSKQRLLSCRNVIPRITTSILPVYILQMPGLGRYRYFHARDQYRIQSPEVQLLSNGRYMSMVTNAGGGYSRWKDIAVTRWREDSTCDNWGSFCFIRDLETNAYWSTAHQPTLKQGDNYEAVFSQGRAEFRRRDHGLTGNTYRDSGFAGR
jgi:cyclic beta-1,2-glucan synthetase